MIAANLCVCPTVPIKRLVGVGLVEQSGEVNGRPFVGDTTPLSPWRGAGGEAFTDSREFRLCGTLRPMVQRAFAFALPEHHEQPRHP